jgi:tyrosyl-tRNA synthetase
MFGKVMSIPDHAMGIFYKLILGWSPAALAELEAGLSEGTLHPNEVKMRLAREIVSIFHSPEAAQQAQKRWDDVFRGGKGIPEDIPQAAITEAEKVVEILKRLNMVSSGGEARRLIEQNGVRLNEVPVTDPNMLITPESLPAVLQVGKRKFVRLTSE